MMIRVLKLIKCIVKLFCEFIYNTYTYMEITGVNSAHLDTM